MGCVKPLEAYRGHYGQVTFNRHLSLTKISFKLPCGRCIGCRLERARQWGIRCMHEAKMWPVNSFVTLTYDDAHLPPFGSLCLRDVQLFMKRLRKGKNASAANPVRFFLGGEYGERNLRPHYHVLLFNCGFSDRRLLSERGDASLYTSDELSGYWSTVDAAGSRETLGHASVGEVNYTTAVYCAKYALKKVNGEAAAKHYEVFDENGECYQRAPEFAVMSRRPGIGHSYYEKYGGEYLEHDSVIVEGRESPGTRFYDVRSDSSFVHSDGILCFCKFCANKRKRKRESVKMRSDNTPERLRVKEQLMVAAVERKERKL